MTAARPCDSEGNFLPEGSPPSSAAQGRAPGDWAPFNSRDEFELADLLFTRTEMSRGQVDELMQIWAARTTLEGGTAPFADSKDLHDTIDAIEEGDAPWYSFKVGYDGPRPKGKVPGWMDDSHQVFYRDPSQVVRMLLSNRKFDGDFDYVPYREYENDERKWGNFMSGTFCWKQAVCLIAHTLSFTCFTSRQDMISEDEKTHGSMLVTLLLGSDKTTVSVATGQNDYYPLYLSVGNISNRVRRAHEDGVIVIGFLAIPKCMFTQHPSRRSRRSTPCR